MCLFSVSGDAVWEAGLESGMTERTKNCVVNCIPGQTWAVGVNFVCATPKHELSLHACSVIAWAVGLPNGKPRQDQSQSALF